MITTALLPINQMDGSDWDKINAGFIISGTKDEPIPTQNFFVTEIIEYLFNIELHISNYTDQHQEFYFGVVAHLWERLMPYSEGVNILGDADDSSLSLEVIIDGKRFAKVDKHEALRMIARLMLDSIPKYLLNRTDFDGEKFYQYILPILKPIADGTRTFQDEEFPL